MKPAKDKKAKEVKKTEFETHVLSCKKCQTVDLTKSASFINTCLNGAPLLLDHVSVAARKNAYKRNKLLKVQFEDVTRTSKAKLKELIKYKENDLFSEVA